MSNSLLLPEIKPSLEFEMHLPAKPVAHLVMGKLRIKKDSGAAGVLLQATSGCKGNQFFGSWTRKGRGPLPPTQAIAPPQWTISTQRLWLPHVKGVEGSFYAIAPFQVVVGSVARGDFGCHHDSGGPGSLGCCVLPIQDHWDAFRKAMADFREAGCQSVPLSVRYWLSDSN